MRYRPDATQGFLSSRIFSDHADAGTDGPRLLSSSLSSFFSLYSRFNKGIMVIAIRNKQKVPIR